VHKLAFGLEPDAALATLVSALAEALASSKATHGSAARFLDSLHSEGELFLSAVRRSVRHATAVVAMSLGGGTRGNLILHCDEVLYLFL